MVRQTHIYLLAKGKCLIDCSTMCLLQYCMLFVYNESVRLQQLMSSLTPPALQRLSQKSANQLIKMFSLFLRTVHQETFQDAVRFAI